MNHFQHIQWQDGEWGFLKILDQRKLPAEEDYLLCKTLETLAEAIQTLAVRGAPAIGIGAAYGAVLAAQKLIHYPLQEWEKVFQKGLSDLRKSRPTAVNLFWALEQQERVFQDFISQDIGLRKEGSGEERVKKELLDSLLSKLLSKAKAIHSQDREMCQKIGIHGASLLPQKGTVLTHCNAGSLATGGMGTALGVIYQAVGEGKKIEVYADETRPLLQGSRLTAWELFRNGIPVKVLADNMAASLLSKGKVDLILVGADRIGRKGHTANKIGTFGLAILARHFNIPFYVAAPSSTFDLTILKGEDIPIEERSREELLFWKGYLIAPKDVDVYNPAFDVTPPELITAIITEKGIIQPVNEENILALLA
ncbi:MAG: S-methyl-5-thioribose-1-phosphate isomerase [Planctomycetota bacterium]|nr:MAG: S-methyl-5-thioribose-1-phosphate isomerase [Planctomycetota bacterium]